MSKKSDKGKTAKINVSAEIADAFKALGGDWEAKAEEVLRAHVLKPAGKVRDFITEMAGTYLPQLETVARDVAGKVAKDVAAAAAAAAMAGWATAGKSPETAKPAPQPKPAATRKPATRKPAAAKAAAKPRAATRAKPGPKPKPKP